MKQILSLSVFAFLLILSCHRGNQGEFNMTESEEYLADTLVYARLVEGFDKQFSAIEAEYDSASSERQLELEAEFEELDRAMVEAQKQFIRDYPASFQSLKVLYEIDWSFASAPGFREYLELLDPSLREHGHFKELDNLVMQMEQVEVGRIAPDFTILDVSGIPRKLSEQYRGSSYLLLDFWASHCGPCRKENVNIRKAYDRFHDQGFDVLGVSTDTRREYWITAIEKDSLAWTNVCSLEPWSENEVVRMYALRQVSQNFLLDSSGKIIATELRGEELLATLAELFD